MPCVVCLDDFVDAGNDATSATASLRAPHALRCGHIFHGECIASWFAQCRTRTAALSCPQCKSSGYMERDVVRLFPGDSHDLDAHLQRHSASQSESSKASQRHAGDDPTQDPLLGIIPGLLFQGGPVQRVRSAIEGGVKKEEEDNEDDEDEERGNGQLDKGKMPEEHDTALLSSLLDFTRSLQAYVIAVHGLRLQAVRKAGKRVWQFVDEHVSQSEQTEELKGIFESLHVAVEEFEIVRLKMEKRLFKHQEEERKYQQKFRRLQNKSDALDAEKQQLALDKESMANTRKELSAFELKLFAQSKSLDEQKRELAQSEAQMKQEVREARVTVSRTKIEAKEEIRRNRDEAEQMVDEMRAEVADYQRRMKEAERESEAAKTKSMAMATQMRTNEKKMFKLKEKETRLKEELQENEAEIDRLRLIIAQGNAYTQASDAQAEPSVSNSKKRKQPKSSEEWSLEDDTSKGRPGPSHVGRLLHRSAVADGSFDNSSSFKDNTESSSPPLVGRKQRYILAQSASYTNESMMNGSRSLFIETPNLDDEMADDFFPMPGGIRGRPVPIAAPKVPLQSIAHSKATVDPSRSKAAGKKAISRTVTPTEVDLDSASSKIPQASTPPPRTPSRNRLMSFDSDADQVRRSTSRSPSKRLSDRTWHSPFAAVVDNGLSPRKTKPDGSSKSAAGAGAGKAKYVQGTLSSLFETLPSKEGASSATHERGAKRPFLKSASTSTAVDQQAELRRLMSGALAGTVATGAKRRA